MELCLFKSLYNYFTIILQSSVGTLEGHSEGSDHVYRLCVGAHSECDCVRFVTSEMNGTCGLIVRK